MVDYTLRVEASTPDPLSDHDSDERRLDNFQHVAEMQHIKGKPRVEYGGEHPWTHVWSGRLVKANRIDAFELPDKPSIREQIEYAVDSLMTFFPTEQATPADTTPSDFNWLVVVHDKTDRSPIYSGRRVQVIWEPR